MQPEQRLAGARRAEDDGGAVGPVAVGEHLIEDADTGGALRACRLEVRRQEGSVEALEDVEPVAPDAQGVFAAGELAAPQFADANVTGIAHAVTPETQLDDAVAHGELGQHRQLLHGVRADEECGDGQRAE